MGSEHEQSIVTYTDEPCRNIVELKSQMQQTQKWMKHNFIHIQF